MYVCVQLKKYLFIFNWLMMALQYWFDICYTSAWISHRRTYVPPPWASLPPLSLSHPSRLLWIPGLRSMSHTANSHWLSILYTVLYRRPCCSLHSSHLLLLLSHLCPYVCSLYLGLHCCSVNRFISIILLDSILCFNIHCFYLSNFILHNRL